MPAGGDGIRSRPWTLTRRTVEQYQFNDPDGFGWAIITLDERGIFQSVSDFGSYSYEGWGHHGCASFKHFLVTLRDPDYFLGKMLGGRERGRDFNAKATVREFRRRILEKRREDSLSAATAREAWDELAASVESFGGLDLCGDRTAFVYELEAQCPRLFARIFDSDPCSVVDSCADEWPPQALMFWEVFRERLVPALQAEIAPRTTAVQPADSAADATGPRPAGLLKTESEPCAVAPQERETP